MIVKCFLPTSMASFVEWWKSDRKAKSVARGERWHGMTNEEAVADIIRAAMIRHGRAEADRMESRVKAELEDLEALARKVS